MESGEELMGERDSGRLASLEAVSMGWTSILSPTGEQWGVLNDEATKLYMNIETALEGTGLQGGKNGYPGSTD